MKPWKKQIIALTLVFVLSFCSFSLTYIQTKKAEAAPVPFIVDNLEWLIPLLVAVGGIAVATREDAVAAAHQFAYSMDGVTFSLLQDMINNQIAINAFGLSVTGLVALGIYDEVKAAAESLVGYYDTAVEKTIDYIISSNLTKIDGLQQWPNHPQSPADTLNIPYQIIVYNENFLTTSLVASYVPFYVSNVNTLSTSQFARLYRLVQQNTWTNIGNSILNINYTHLIATNAPIYTDISLTNVHIGVSTQQIPVSHLLKKDEGISINDQVRNIPMPLPGVSWPYHNTYVKPLPGIEAGINLRPHDVLWQQNLDSFGNPVLDGAGNPTYSPVPWSWPNTYDQQFPPWVLNPDIPGIAEGVGAIGGILEGIRTRIGEIGAILTTTGTAIITLITDLPNAIVNKLPPSQPSGPDKTGDMPNFRLPDLFFLFLGVLMASIRLMLRFMTFLGLILTTGATSSGIPEEMAYGLNQLKAWSFGGVSFYTMLSGLASFFFGLKVLKFVRRYVAQISGQIENEHYREEQRELRKQERLKDREMTIMGGSKKP